MGHPYYAGLAEPQTACSWSSRVLAALVGPAGICDLRGPTRRCFAIGAGTGSVCMGWKGGMGTSSRVLPPKRGGYTAGVLVQTNFGGVLTVNGAPIGRELGRYSNSADSPYEIRTTGDVEGADPDGSVTAIVATEEAVISSVLKATTVVGRNGRMADAIDIDQLLEVTRKHNALNWSRTLPPWGGGR